MSAPLTPPAWPSLDQLRAGTRYGLALALITLVAVELAAMVRGISSG